MPRVKIKSQDVSSGAWTNILRIFRLNNVKCSKLMPLSDGYFAHCNSSSDVDTIFSSAVLNKLKHENYLPVTPGNLQARRTVISRYLDEVVCCHSQEEIIQEINSQNDWLTVELVVKFKSNTGVKLICETVDMAQRCIKDGFYMFNLSISPNTLKCEDYIQVSYCYRCYAIGEHLIADCPCPNDYKICSNCSSDNHTYSNCPSPDTRKCVNCKTSTHHTLAYSCPKRKEYIASKLQQKSSTPVNYSDVAKSGNSNSTDSIVIAHILVTVAIEKTKDNPNLFNSLLNNLLIENHLPTVKLDSLSNLLPKSVVNQEGKLKNVSSHNSSSISHSSSPSHTSNSYPPSGSSLSKRPPHKENLTPNHGNTPISKPIGNVNRPTIVIFKRSDLVKDVSKKNIKKFASEGKVFLSSDTKNEHECLEYLLANNSDDYFKNIVTLPIDIFVQKLNIGIGTVSSSVEVRKSTRLNK